MMMSQSPPDISLRVFFQTQDAKPGFRFVNQFVPRGTFWTLVEILEDDAKVQVTRLNELPKESTLKLDLSGAWRRFADNRREYRWIVASPDSGNVRLSEGYYDTVAAANADLAKYNLIAVAPVPGIFRDIPM